MINDTTTDEAAKKWVAVDRAEPAGGLRQPAQLRGDVEHVLGAVHRDAGIQLYWLTPEPRHAWTLGSCDLERYEPLCDRVEVVRTIDQLGRFAEELVTASEFGAAAPWKFR